MKRSSLILISLVVLATMVASCAAPTESPEAAKLAEPTKAPEPTMPPAPTVAPTVAPTKAPEPTQPPAPAATAATVPSKRDGDIVMIGMHQKLEFLNVLYTQGGNSLSAAKMAQRGLLFLDKDSNWIGELAAEVPSTKNGLVTADGKKITFKLRKGITWHDGKPVTSADVKATWEMIMDENNTVITRFGYNKIGSIDTPDELTAVVNFKDQFASWPILFDAIIPKHIIDANKANLDKSEAMRQPIGFGPYKITEWKAGDYVRYEAFDNFYLGKPKISQIVIKFYPSVDALMLAITAKEVDMGWSMPISNVPQLKNLESQGILLIKADSPGTERYHMNPAVPVFQDINVRKAIWHAVDKKTLVKTLLFDLTVPGASEWSGSPWANTNLVDFEYDLTKCQSMLDTAGWKPGSDGVRVKDGQRLSFSHSTTSGNLSRENMQLAIQQMLKACGVEMMIANKPSTELFGGWTQNGTWSQGTYEMGGWGHGLRVPDPEVSSRFLCSQIASDKNQSGSQWYRYCNPDLDTLLTAQSKEFDATKRKDMYMKIQETIDGDAYTNHLYVNIQVYSVRAELKNFYLHTFANFYFNPQEWSW